MARHCPELTLCSTAELEQQASHPPVKFVNGFQKRLGVYMTDTRENDISSDSETDISSLEIDSNLSHSSDLSNTDSPNCAFLSQNNEHLGEKFSTANNSQRSGNFDGVDAKQHTTPLPDETQSDNSFRQNNLALKNISRDDLLLPLSVNKPKVAPISHQRNSDADSPGKTLDSNSRDKPLVIKIRRRTWTVSENSQCHESIQNGGVKKSKINGPTCTQQADTNPAFELSSSSNYNNNNIEEWQSIGDCLPDKKHKAAEKFFPPKPENNKKVLEASKTKHHQRRKSKKLKGEFTEHRKKKTSHQHHHKTKRKKSRENSFKEHSKSNPPHPGKTLRLPTDPQKAVKVLERALESINAQIKQLKKETSHGNKPRSHRGLRSKKSSKKRLHKETRSTKIEKKPDLLPVTMSLFKLHDSFSIVPSLIVRDGDLHPAYSASVDPREPPANHPIWRWRIGQTPLPKPTAHDNQVMDWLNN